MAVESAGPYASLHLAPDRYPLQHPTTQFLQAGCPSCRPTNSVKALKAITHDREYKNKKLTSLNMLYTFCSVLFLSRPQGLATPWTYFLHSSLSSVSLTDSSTGSRVHVKMSIQAVRGLPRLRAPGIVPIDCPCLRYSPAADHAPVVNCFYCIVLNPFIVCYMIS